jgi:hypothetical protein
LLRGKRRLGCLAGDSPKHIVVFGDVIDFVRIIFKKEPNP